MSEIAALIFDFDGLILDTEVPIFEAWQEDYAAFGEELPLETYVGCVGSDFGGFDPKLYLEDRVGKISNWDELDEAREQRCRAKVDQMNPMPGIEAILVEAAEKRVPCAVASSSPLVWVGPHLERLGLRDRFAAIRTRDDVERIKPEPDLFLAAAKAMEVEPERAVVFEDSLNGVKAARAAGCRCVAVPNRVTAHLDLGEADWRVETLAEVSLGQVASALSV